MNANNSQIANAVAEPSISNVHPEASINQLISTGIVTTSQPSIYLNMTNMVPSQPLLTSGQSRLEILLRQREARRRRRRRRAQRRREQRAELQHQQLAHQIRRRQMANQAQEQPQYHRRSRYEERYKEEQRDRRREEYLQRRSPTFNELFEEVIEERLLETYDWETMQPQDRWEQEQLYELEGIAALEQLALVKDEVEQSQRIHELEASEEEQQLMEPHRAAEWDQERLRQIEGISTSKSFDSILDYLEHIKQISDLERSQEAEQQREHDHAQMQLQQWEESDCLLEHLKSINS